MTIRIIFQHQRTQCVVLIVLLTVLGNVAVNGFYLEPTAFQKIERSDLVIDGQVVKEGEPAVIKIQEVLKGAINTNIIKVSNAPPHTEDSGHIFRTGEALILFLKKSADPALYQPIQGSFGVAEASDCLGNAVKKVAQYEVSKNHADKSIDLIESLLLGCSYEQEAGIDIIRRTDASLSHSLGRSNKIVDALIRLLNSEAGGVRRDAAYVLGNIQSEKAIPKLIALIQDKEGFVAETALDALTLISHHDEGKLPANATATQKKILVEKWLRWWASNKDQYKE